MPALPPPPPPTPMGIYTLLTSAAELGAAIRAARKARGLSHLEAARRCRVGPRFLLELERGKPSVRLDKTLAVMYGVGLAGIVVPMEVVSAALAQGR